MNPSGVESRDVYLLYEFPYRRLPARKEILDVMIEYRVEEDSEMAAQGLHFSGQKSVEEVTGIIQNRVQVYVNENS